MFQEERFKEILARIDKSCIVTVEELEKALYVSRSTVRRDLAELAKRGLITRSSGGAMAISQMKKSTLAQEINGIAPAENAIGMKAAQLVCENSTILLNCSALARSMVPWLEGKPGLTVVTDSADIATALCGKGVQIYCTSGRYAATHNAFCGGLAAQFVGRFRYDMAFIGCDAFTPEGTLSYRDLALMPVLQAAVRCSKKRVLLCDAARLGDHAGCNILTLKEIDIVVTDVPGRFQNFTGRLIATE